MRNRPRILIAAAAGLSVLKDLFETHAEIIYASTLPEAARKLDEEKFELIVCTIHFDDSRMFDLLRYVRAMSSPVPCVCTRVLDTTLRGSLLTAMTIAVDTAGATFIDLPQPRTTASDEEFRKRVLEQIPKVLTANGR